MRNYLFCLPTIYNVHIVVLSGSEVTIRRLLQNGKPGKGLIIYQGVHKYVSVKGGYWETSRGGYNNDGKEIM